MEDESYALPESVESGGISSLRGLKRRLLREYRSENKGIIEQLEKSAAGYNSDQLINLIIEDMLQSTEDLQGTSLMLENEGNMRDASAITIKRADLLRLVADIVSRKKELNQRSGMVDLNSPAFFIFQKLCFDKMVEVMEEMNLDVEMMNLLVTGWQEKMQTWDKDMKRALKELEE